MRENQRQWEGGGFMKRLWPRSQGRDQTSWALATLSPDWKGMGLSVQWPFPTPKQTDMAY